MAFLLSKTQFVRLLSTAAATATKAPYKNQILSNELVSQYHRDGFLLMEDFLTPKEKKDLIEWTNEIQNWPETKGIIQFVLFIFHCFFCFDFAFLY